MTGDTEIQAWTIWAGTLGSMTQPKSVIALLTLIIFIAALLGIQSSASASVNSDVAASALLQAKIGLKEKGGENCGPPLDKYWGPGVCGPVYPWAGMFATWVMRSGGSSIPKYAYVGDIVSWGQENGKAFRASSGYRAEAGDVFVLEGNTHAGIIVGGSQKRFKTVEGNRNDRVSRATVKRSSVGWIVKP